MSEQRPKAATLARFKAFAALEPEELEALAGALRVRRLGAGERLFAEGEPADGCYLIARGRVRVSVGRSDGPEQLAMLGRGDLVGQMSLLDGGRRSATCDAVEPSVVLHMSRSEFDLVFRSGSSFALKFVDALTRMLVGQLRFANRRLLALTRDPAQNQARDPRVRACLKAVATRTLAGNLDDVELDAVEVVIPDGLRRD